MTSRARRFEVLPGKRRGPAGERLCRRCSGPVPPGRREWCSQACVDEYLIRSSQTGARRFVEKRDHGICSSCGLDTERIVRLLRTLGRMAHAREAMEFHGPMPRDVAESVWRGDRWHWHGVDMPYREAAQRRFEIMAALVDLWAGRPVVNRFGTVERSLWEADHIVPLVEGGGPGPENLRTLCRPCHVRVTRDLRARMARARRRQRPLPLEA